MGQLTQLILNKTETDIFEMILARENIKTTIGAFFKDKPVKKVWLFGSYARGDADNDSDIDVLVDIDKDARIGLDYFAWHLDLAEQLKKKVDVVSLGWVNHRLWPHIQKDMTIVYEK